jgi:hypothetical protein
MAEVLANTIQLRCGGGGATHGAMVSGGGREARPEGGGESERA